MYCVIPLLTVVILFFAKRKRLWTAPLISTALAFVVYMTAIFWSPRSSAPPRTDQPWFSPRHTFQNTQKKTGVRTPVFRFFMGFTR